MSDGATTGGSAPSAPTTTATAPSAPAAPSNAAAKPAAPTTTATPPDTSAPPEPRHKIKVRGEERELGLSELLKLAEKADGAEARYREVSKREKEVETLLQRIPADPVGAMEALVGDRSQAAKTIRSALLRDPAMRAELEREMLEMYEYEAKSPAEQAKLREQEELREKARRLDALEREQASRREEQQAQHIQTQLGNAFGQALQSVGLKQSKATMRAMVAETEQLVEDHYAGKRRLTMADISAAAARVKADLDEDRRSSIGSLDADALEALLGEEKIAELRKRDLERLKPKVPEVTRTPGKGKAPPERASNGQFTAKPRGVVPSSYWKRIRGE